MKLDKTTKNSVPSLRCSKYLFSFVFLSVMKKINFGFEYVLCCSLNFWCGLCVLFEKERIFQMLVAMTPFVFFFKPETVEVVLSSTKLIDKAAAYDFGHPWVGTGLATSTGQKWHYRRKLLTPTFHFRVLENYISVISDHSRMLISRLRELGKDQWTDIVPLINSSTLEIICETAMGVRIDSQTGEGKKYLEATRDLSNIFLRRVLCFWLHPEFIFRITPSGRRFYKNVDLVHSFTTKVMKQKKSEMIANNNLINKSDLEVNDDSLNRKRHTAFLELLLEHHLKDPSFTEEDIREEVTTFMFAGFDTTSMAISWALYLIGLHRDVQNKILEELNEIFEGDDEREIERNDILRMKYLECVIKETLRIYSSVPFVAREVKENFKVLDYEVKKGSLCLVFFYMLHRDPKSFPDPEKFDPERFFPENVTGRHPYAYVPFSAGPRNCIGQKFAIMEEKILLANILRTFEVTSRDPRDKVNIYPSLILQNLEPLMLRFTPRNVK